MQQDEFSLRHIGPSESEIKKMLSSLDVESIEELLIQTCLLYTSDAADE